MLVALWMIHLERRWIVRAIHIDAEIAQLTIVNKVGVFPLTEVTFTVRIVWWPLEEKLEGMVRVAGMANILW